jgi:hypothetical protein
MTTQAIDHYLYLLDDARERAGAAGSAEGLGYKRCPAHLTCLSRLPEAAQTPLPGYEDDVSVRPLSEFGSMASCKTCAKVRAMDERAATRGDASSAAVRHFVRLLQKQTALQMQLEALGAALREVDQAAARALVQQA